MVYGRLTSFVFANFTKKVNESQFPSLEDGIAESLYPYSLTNARGGRGTFSVDLEGRTRGYIVGRILDVDNLQSMASCSHSENVFFSGVEPTNCEIAHRDSFELREGAKCFSQPFGCQPFHGRKAT